MMLHSKRSQAGMVTAPYQLEAVEGLDNLRDGGHAIEAIIFARHVLLDVPLQAAVTAPRWLLGRDWGVTTANVKAEDRRDPDVIRRLRNCGHDIEIVPGLFEMTGHPGAIVRHPDGLREAASDPRSDGAVASR